MRNLKRALSLAMASVMMLGLMVVGASAKGIDDFSDSAAITNKDAVAVTSAIGVFEGYEDGSYRPENVVTRAEMAVIISKMLYGANFDAAQFANQNTFTDVPDWAKGYVNVCVSNGIIVGYGDGRFGSNDTITTAQAAMMLCKALGWFKSEKDVGEDWILSATARATNIGLFEDLKLATGAGLTRDNVAKMTFNALTNASTVEYSDSFGVYYTTGNSWANGYKFLYTETLGYKHFDLIYDNSNADDLGRPSTIWGTGSLNAAGIGTGKVLDEDGDIVNGAARIAAKDEIITTADEADAVLKNKVTSKKLYDAIGSKTVNNLGKVTLVIDGDSVTSATAGSLAANIKGSISGNRNKDDADFSVDAGGAALTGNGDVTEIYVDKNDVTIVITHTYAAKVRTVDSSRGTITLNLLNGGPGVLRGSQFDNTDTFETTGFRTGDFVTFTYSNGMDKIQSVTPATKLEGNVTRVKDISNFVVGGSTYNYNRSVNNANKLDQSNVNNSVVAYLSDAGYVVYIDQKSATYDYAYVLSSGVDTSSIYGDTNSTYYARLVLSDGTVVKAKAKTTTAPTGAVAGTLFAGLNKYNGVSNPANNTDNKDVRLLAHSVVAYTVDDGGVYTLTRVDRVTNNSGTVADAFAGVGTTGTPAAAASTTVSIDEGKASFSVNGTGYVANSSTVFVVADSDTDLDDYDFTVYTGFRRLPDIDHYTAGTTFTKAAVAATNGVARFVYVEDGNNKGVKDVIYIMGNSGGNAIKDGASGDYYYEFDAVIDGEITTVKVKTDNTTVLPALRTAPGAATAAAAKANQFAISRTKFIVAVEKLTVSSSGFVTGWTPFDARATVNNSNGAFVVRSILGEDDETLGIGNYDATEITFNTVADPGSFAYSDKDDVAVAFYSTNTGKLSVGNVSDIADDPNDWVLAVLKDGELIGVCIIQYD